jgi:Carbohydrate-binding module 48 (Isoamylase N-terminal domain)
MNDDDVKPEHGEDDWTSFERRFRAAYDATPPGAPPIVLSPMPRHERSRVRRYGWLVGCAAAGIMAFLLVWPSPLRTLPPPASTVASFAQFALTAPGANRVTVVGDFNQWDPHASPLARSADGRWRMRIPMQPGRHEYAFVIDNHHWVTDPLAPQAPDLGFGHPNSVVLATVVRQ